MMSAGTGIQHSEINGSTDEYLSLFQIWIIPNKENVVPRYDQKSFGSSDRKNKLQTMVSSIDEDFNGSLKIHQNVKISRIDLDENQIFKYELLSESHGVYVMNIHGDISIDDNKLNSRDALGVSEASSFEMKASENSEVLFIEVPMI